MLLKVPILKNQRDGYGPHFTQIWAGCELWSGRDDTRRPKDASFNVTGLVGPWNRGAECSVRSFLHLWMNSDTSDPSRSPPFSFRFQTAPIKLILAPFDLLPSVQCAHAHTRSLNSRGVRTFSLSSFPSSVSLPLCVTIILPHVPRSSGRHVGRSRRKKKTDFFFWFVFSVILIFFPALCILALPFCLLPLRCCGREMGCGHSSPAASSKNSSSAAGETGWEDFWAWKWLFCKTTLCNAISFWFFSEPVLVKLPFFLHVSINNSHEKPVQLGIFMWC